MIPGSAYRRRRAAMIKAALVLATALVLFTPKLENFQLPDVGLFDLPPFVAAAQANES